LVKMRWQVKVCFLLSGVFLVVAVFSYFYEASSLDFLQVINYPLRPYTIPLSILGLFFLFSSIALHKFCSEGK